MRENYRICNKCVMDTVGDPNIEFDKDGVCQYYRGSEKSLPNFVFTDKQARINQEKLTNEIRTAGKGKEYDCLVGISGGVDSSYTAYWAKEMGLRPLAIHFDNGWNSETAVSNIENLVKKLDIDLYTYVVNWDEFADLQRSFFKASVVDVEMITDNSHKAVSLSVAKKYGIKYHIHGGNFRTENMMPPFWNWNKQDVRNIKSIHKRHGTIPIKSYKYITDSRWEIMRRLGVGGTFVMPLNQMNYSKTKAMELLKNRLGWRYYGGKHFESVFTKFYQAYYLPEKFNIDKRKVHYSSLILNGEISREAAIEELKSPPYKISERETDRAFVLKKLGFSESEWEEIMNTPPKRHLDYKSNYKTRKFIQGIYHKTKKWNPFS